MAQPIHTIKPSFSGGEFAPSLFARTDIQKYGTGARKLRNFFVHPHGGISNRPGLHYVATSKKNNSKVRVVDFQFSTTENFIIEFGDYYCRFYTNNGQIIKSQGTTWATATVYVLNDITNASSNIYRCIQACTSGTGSIAADVALGKFTVDINTWAVGQTYATGTYLYYTNGTAAAAIYFTAQNHTSATFTVDLAAGKVIAQTIYEVPTPYDENDLADLRFAQSADILYIVHPDFAPRELIRSYDTVWTLGSYANENGPFRLANDTTTTMKSSLTSGTGTLTASAAYFDPLHVGSLFELTHYISGQAISQSFEAAGTTSYVACGGTWRLISHGTWSGTFKVQKSEDATTWTDLRQFSSTAGDLNVNTFGTEDMSDGALPFYIRLNMQTQTAGTANIDLSSDPFYHLGIVEVTGYTSTTVVNAEVQRRLGSTATTTNWAEGSWSDYRKYPKTVAFSQDRLVTGGSYSEPQTIWMTQSGNYYDYFRNSPLVDSDGISINLPSQKLNTINGLVPLLQLLALSTGAEWSVGASGNEILSPTTVNTQLNSSTGSSGVQPVVIVNRAIYVQSRGNVIRDLGYDLFSNTFSGGNLSILANHLFTNYSIVDMAYQQDPDSLVFAVRNDGTMLCMTYMREQEVLAWTWWDTNDGDDLFESVAVIPATGYNQVWVVVNRGGQRYIEYFDQRGASELIEDQFFVDCGITYDQTTAVETYTKLLMHNDTSAFADVKSHGVTVSSVVFNNTAEKFGAGCAEYNGYTSSLRINDSADFTIGTGNFCLEFWASFDRLAKIEYLFGQYNSTITYSAFFKDETDKLGMSFVSAGTTQADYITSASYVFNTGQMYHLMFERNGSNALVFINGVSQPLITLTTFGTNDLANIAGVLSIGKMV